MIGKSTNKSKASGIQKLPPGFEPSPYSVIIGRAKECKQSSGNRRLRIIATAYLPQYASATNRSVKSHVVSHIVSMVRQSCGSQGGAFIKNMGKANGGSTIWAEVSDSAAREKIGYVFRDLLCDNYRSSSKSKSVNRLRKQRSNDQEEQVPRRQVQRKQVQRKEQSSAAALQLQKVMESLSSTKSNLDFVAFPNMNIPSTLIAIAKRQSQLFKSSPPVKPDFQKSESSFQVDPTPVFFTPAVRRKSDVAWIEVMAENLEGCF